MSFSSVRIEGVLDADARKLSNDSVFYVINDGTGTISTFASPPPNEKLPMIGSHVSVVGNISIGAGNEIRLQARLGEYVVVISEPVIEPFVSEFDLADITAEQAGERMTVYGRVSNIWYTQEGSRAPTKIVLRDDSGSLSIVHWLKESPDIQPGDELKITGTVNLYKGRLQLKLWSATDIQPYLTEP